MRYGVVQVGKAWLLLSRAYQAEAAEGAPEHATSAHQALIRSALSLPLCAPPCFSISNTITDTTTDTVTCIITSIITGDMNDIYTSTDARCCTTVPIMLRFNFPCLHACLLIPNMQLHACVQSCVLLKNRNFPPDKTPAPHHQTLDAARSYDHAQKCCKACCIVNVPSFRVTSD